MRRFNKHKDRTISRRQWMAMLGIGGATTMAGCLGDDDDEADDTAPEADTDDTDDTADDDGDDDVFGDADDDADDTDDTADDDGEEFEFPEVSGTYNTAIGGSLGTLNPIYNQENTAGIRIGYTLDVGYTWDENNEYFPLMYDMSTDDGGAVWVFDLREDLEFSDPYGEVTAETFEYYISEVHQNEAMASPGLEEWTMAGEPINVEVTGEYQFQAELPVAQFLWPETAAPNEYAIPKDLIQPYVEEEDPDGLEQNEELLELTFTGNLGAYTLEEWQRDAGTTHVRNDDYYLRNLDYGPRLFEQAPYFEEVQTQLIEETSIQLEALSDGELDVNGIPAARAEEFRADENVDVLDIPTPYNNALQPNLRDDGWQTGPGNPMRIKEFRQAMACAISKEAMIEQVWRGQADTHYTWQPQWSEWYPGDDDLELYGSEEAGMYGRDVAEELAMEAFEQSEYDYGFDGDRMVTPDDDQVELDIYYSEGSETSELMATFISQEFDENLGIDVIMEPVDGGRFQNQFFGGAEMEGGTDTIRGEEVEWESPSFFNPGPRDVTTPEPWDLSVIFGFNVYPRNPLSNDAFFDGATAGTNAHAWYPGFDAPGLFDQARAAETRDELQEVFNELFVEINREQPYIMLSFDDDTVGYNPDLEGPFEGFNSGWDFPAWYIPE